VSLLWIALLVLPGLACMAGLLATTHSKKLLPLLPML
jgi:hypothetical protein